MAAPAPTEAPRTPALRPVSRGFVWVLAGLLALLHGVLAWTATVDKSITADETGYLAAGLVYQAWGDYRLQPENGNLAQRWVALPLAGQARFLPPTADAAWLRADVWRYGYAFLYRSGFASGEALYLARGMTALVSAALALLVFAWSRRLFGPGAGLFSEALLAFSPPFLAHGALATSDVITALAFLASVGAFWSFCDRPGWPRALASALALGLALVIKYSAILLPPMLGLVWLGSILRRDPRSAARRPGRWRAALALHVVVPAAIIWACYGFRYPAFAPGLPGASFSQSWDSALAGLGLPGAVIDLARRTHVLPEAWLFGLAEVLGYAQQRGAFWNGQHSLTGWPAFFPYAFAVKSTLATLAVAGLTVMLVAGRTGRHLRDGTAAFASWFWPYLPLATLGGFYWATSIASHLNIGLRHILVTYPPLFIIAGALVPELARRRFRSAVLWVLLGMHLAASSRARPDYLAYFNELAGGTGNGWRHLVDSSLDWGQDLPGLAKRLAGEEPARCHLAYFGTGNPVYEGVRATIIYALPQLGAPHPWVRLEAGLYIISATVLQEAYGSVRGPWTAEAEREFAALRDREAAFLEYAAHPARPTPEPLAGLAPAQIAQAWRRYEDLRLARLAYYCRLRGPAEDIGGSLLLFHLSEAEIHAATRGTLRDWARLLEEAAGARP